MPSTPFGAPFRLLRKDHCPSTPPFALPPPDLPDLRPTSKTQVGQSQDIEKHSLFTICPTCPTYFEEICFKATFTPSLHPRPPPLRRRHALLPIEPKTGRAGRAVGRSIENWLFPAILTKKNPHPKSGGGRAEVGRAGERRRFTVGPKHRPP